MLHLITRLRAIFALLLLSPAFTASASHIVGTDLTYEWLSGSTYKIRLAVYADCGLPSAGAFATLHSASPQVCVYNGSTLSATLSLICEVPTSGVEVTPPLCPGYSSQCLNSSSITPGITLFIYTITYSVPSASAVWRFVYTGNMGVSSSAGRAAAITNIMTAGSTTMQLEDTLNNMAGHNSSPVLNIIPLPYYSINIPHTYNPVAIDAEGDSLVYSLVDATNGTSTCGTVGGAVTYASGTSATAPLLTAPGSYSFNTHIGQLSFNPNALQRACVVYHIQEYRAGVLVGTVQREMTILINGTTDHLPGGYLSTPVACTIVDSTDISVCDTVSAYSVQLPATDGDPLDTITVSYLGLPAGATLTTTNNMTPHPVSTFSWTTTSVPDGLYTFFVKYADNACPMNGSQAIGYTVNVHHCTGVPTEIPNVSGVPSLKVSPNPSSGLFEVQLPMGAKDASITVADAIGRIIYQQQMQQGVSKATLNLSQLPAGNYMLRVVTGNETYREKILINK
jgi:hypothetical protein